MENYTPIQSVAQQSSYLSNKAKAFTLYDEKTVSPHKSMYITWAICAVTGTVPFILFYLTILFQQLISQGTLGVDFLGLIINGLPLTVGIAFVYCVGLFIITKDISETLFTMIYLVIGYVILGYALHIIGIFS